MRATTPVGAAVDADWDTEYLDLKMAIAVVDSLDDAIDHINRHGTGHSEAIVTSSDEAADEFTSGVDAACVYVNASTRFTDGFEFGMGAEIGNSTQKLHARGPIGAARADDVQVRAARQRPDQGVARSLRSESSAGRSTRRTSATWCWPTRRHRSSGSSGCCWSRPREAPHRRIEPEPGPEVRLEMVELVGRRRRAARGLDVEVEREGPSYTFRTLELLHE